MTVDELIDGIIEREGGFVHHPADKGGPTNHGITRATYEAYLGRRVTIDEIRKMPTSVARDIYVKQYITNYQFDKLTYEPLKVALADLAVNAGADDAALAIQRMPGSGLVADGVMGPKTIARMLAMDGRSLYLQVMRYRLRKHVDVVLNDPSIRAALRNDPTCQGHNLRGWINRCNELLA